MTDVTVRLLAEADWADYRAMRLRALQESPEAFSASYAEEEAYDEQRWRDRLGRSRRLLACQDGEPVGILSLGEAHEDFDGAAEIFGLWVPQAFRGGGIATELFTEATQEAVDSGYRQLVYWVSTENVPGVSFASGRGFRPSAQRRPLRVGGGTEEEIAMILALPR